MNWSEDFVCIEVGLGYNLANYYAVILDQLEIDSECHLLWGVMRVDAARWMGVESDD